MQNDICPVCDEGHLVPQTEERELNHNGFVDNVPGFMFSACDHCEAEITNQTQSKTNKRLVVAFRKKAEGFLRGSDIRHLRKQLGINQKVAASIFGGGQVAFSKYENNDVTQSASMDRLLRVARAVPAAFAWLSSYAEQMANVKHRNMITYTFTWDSFYPAPTKYFVQDRSNKEYENYEPKYFCLEAANMSTYEDATKSA